MNSRDRTRHFLSVLGDAVCENCGQSWPCHLTAWGNPANWSRCGACRDGRVFWHPPTTRGES